MTNNVTLEDNVALDVVGHCYFLEKNTEVGNVFRHNLGAGVMNMPAVSVSSLSSQSGRTETDGQSSIYWISNPQNYFYDNIAAGGQGFGFWFETELLTTSGLPLGAMDGCEVHSQQLFAWTTYPPGWAPSEEAIIRDLKVYRNLHWGMFLHVTTNLHFIGGVVADNGQYSVFINRGDAQIFENMDFYGYSGYASQLNAASCPFGQKGIGLHPGRLREFDRAGNFWGSKLINTKFSGYGREVAGCGGTVEGEFYALQMRTEQMFVEAYSAPHYFQNVQFEDEFKLNACYMATEIGVDDLQMEVVSDPYKAFTQAGVPGFLVSRKATAMLPAGVCTPYEECPTNYFGSVDFCTGVCMRTISVETDSATTEGFLMVVSYLNNGAQNILIEGKLRGGDTDRFHRTFTVALPAGQFAIGFFKNNQIVWPGYVRPVFETAPACSNYVQPSDLTIINPGPNRPQCAVGQNLVYNGLFLNSVEGWGQLNTGMVFTPNEGVGGSGALKTTTVTNFLLEGVTQHLDTSCIAVGHTYSISVSFRNVNTAGVTLPACFGGTNDCPYMFGTRQSFDLYTGEATVGYIHGMASTELPYQMNGFNTMTGTWTVSAEDAAADSIHIKILGGTGQLIIDNVFITRIA